MAEDSKRNERADPIVGIDLGTTNSLVAYFDQAGPRVLNSPEGESLLPSVVRFSEKGKVEAIGTAARAHAVEFPRRTVNSVKRLMGRSKDDLDTAELDRLGYEVIEGPQDTARVRVNDAVLSPPEVSAHVLAELQRWASAALGTDVKRAVVTVPAYFDDAQRQATRDAGRLAGLDIVRIVNEPTAAALAYGGMQSVSSEVRSEKKADGSVSLSTKLNPEACTSSGEPSRVDSADNQASSELIAVYDLGGGTFDISILRLERDPELGAVDQVLATAGDTHLGGDDFDHLLIESIEAQARQTAGTDLSFTPSTRQALRQAAEAAKITLSTQDTASLELELQSEAGEQHAVRWSMSREEFDQQISPLIKRTLEHCDGAMQSAGVSVDEIDRVVLVGGSTRVPAVREAVEKHFGRRPYTALDPDRVVALGAAVQAAVIAGVQSDRLLLDVIPLSLGIETLGGAVAKVIPANSTIPARASESFSTYVDGQTKVAINIYQGERELAADCRLLGRFDLTGVPPMPAGFPKLQVTFLVDANGILTVEAVEERSGRRADVQVAPSHGLTREEVQRIETESFAHAKQDMEAHRRIDLINQARMDLRAILRQLDRVGEQLEADERRTVEQAIAKVREMIERPSVENDQLAESLTAMDHASVRLAELAIAQTLREEAK